MKKKFTFLIAALMLLAMITQPTRLWGQVVSGTTYSTPSTSSLPTGWSGSDGGGTSYIKLTASSNYIQTSSFSQNGFSSIKIKARKFGGPSDAQALITVSWYYDNSETVLGTIAPTSTDLTDYTISSPANPTGNTTGYIKIQCKGASSGKGSGVSEVTITYTSSGGGSGETYHWVAETNISNLSTSDIFVIVGNNGSNYAMKNTDATNTGPAAVSVSVSAGELTGNIPDNIKWKISGNSTDGFVFYPNGSTTTWLYCTNDNNGLRIGSGNTDYNKFKIQNSYIFNTGRSRYAGIYSSSNWRSYTGYGGNIANQTFTFYKKVTYYSVSSDVYPENAGTVTITNSSLPTGGTATITASAETGYVFSNWSVSEGSSVTNAYASSTTFTMGTENATVTANFIETGAYTITAQSNDDSFGTVSLSGSVITGSPKTGYRYATPAYSVSPANSATVVQDGNTFSVTPSENTTVTINFEAIPSHTLNTAVSPVDAGTVTLGSSTVAEGATTTATAEASAGYKFVNWTISGTGASLSSTTNNSTTVTMGTDNAIITAIFEAVKTYSVHWSVNGTVVKTDDVEENTAITFASPTSGVPEGYVFRGWVTAENRIPTYTNADPKDNYVTSDNCTADTTYYAVMAVLTGTIPTNVTLNASGMSNAQYNTGTRNDDEGNTWSYYASINDLSGTKYFGLNSNSNNYNIGSPSFSGNITAISMKVYNASGSESRKVYICSSNTAAQPTSGDIASLSVPKSSGFSTERSIDLSSSPTFSQFYVYVPKALGFSEIKVTYNKTTYSNYCTTINTFKTAGNWDANNNWSWGSVPTTEPSVTINAACTIPNGTVATVNNIILGGTGSIIIKDGGQLICNNAVQATVEKNISAWPNTTPADGWYFIASPINRNDLAPTDVNHMITDNIPNDDESTPRTYDLYGYDATASKPWVNYRGHSNDFVIANGRGYLYANIAPQTLEFIGNIQPSNENVTVESLNVGYNLVGNPYTCNAYINQNYYMLVDGSTVSATVTDKATPIAPCTGVVVESVANGSVTFSKDYPVASANNGNLQMVLAQNVATRGERTAQTLDKAIVSFNEGSQLGKFYFGTQDANLYIPMDNEEYAIVSSSAQGEMPVNFKAHRDGQYTITVNPQEVEMGYLHLIDNIGGKDIDLLATPSYTFNAKADDYESRFRLVFSANMVNIDLNDDFAFFSNGQLVIANEGESLLQVIDVNGRIVTTESVSGTCSKAINVKAGVYVLRLIQGTDVKSQKIIVK